MSSTRRVYQIAERIKEIVATHLLRAADPRFSLVTVTSAVVTPDLRIAKVYWVVSSTSDDADVRKARIEEVKDALKHAGGYIKKTLSRELDIRFIPTVVFYYDDTLDTVEEVDRILARARASESTSK